MAHPERAVRHWKRGEYERSIDDGMFARGEPLELVGGQLIVAEPQGSRHFAAIQAAEEAPRTAFGPGRPSAVGALSKRQLLRVGGPPPRGVSSRHD